MKTMIVIAIATLCIVFASMFLPAKKVTPTHTINTTEQVTRVEQETNHLSVVQKGLYYEVAAYQDEQDLVQKKMGTKEGVEVCQDVANDYNEKVKNGKTILGTQLPKLLDAKRC